ncbi:helix-hairpin-helix domain-containing protein [Helcobacillus massiliensis]|uniref:Competence protein ComEA n=1 Tax=Helcobacillus massiliensis TaxID=521392 RepID=A0A839QQE3_9MICO|nr:helix-hairpin-helix domain-containing protein [Helcobacillus massiliensis]MBB3022544.1 competence protein ComEA [Helcobacillus massiliensis]
MSQRDTRKGRRAAPHTQASSWDDLEKWARPTLTERVRSAVTLTRVLVFATVIAVVVLAARLVTAGSDSGTVVPPAAAARTYPGTAASDGGGTGGGAERPQPAPASTPGPGDPAAPAEGPEPAAGVMYVYVTGQVPNQGVVRVPAGARVHDAVRAAGGLTGDADTTSLNLARPLQDGEHIHVLAHGEEPPPGYSAGTIGSPGSTGTTGSSSPGSGGGPAEARGTSTGGPGGGADGRININTATAQELQELPGVGPSIAQRIIEFRDANGPFPSVDSLTEVSGIGPATLEKLRDSATV